MMVRRRVGAVVGDSGVFASPPPSACSSSSGPFFPTLSPSPVDPFFSIFFSRHQVVSPGRTARPVESLIRAFEFDV